ncbi:MAG TPA: hypothetical protein VK638_10850 [Edaphobacter sp.]|nr:hypothetical protein [Edaphobacter sp.]
MTVAGKTEAELESLFSTGGPAIMHLQIDWLGLVKTFAFRLEKAEDIARHNGKQFVDGQIVLLGPSERDMHCFLKGSPAALRLDEKRCSAPNVGKCDNQT